MADTDFDIIVIGAGCAGAIAAYVAAKKGKSVLVVERGEYAGAKNMTGGRIYAHSLKRVFDDYSEGEITTEDIPYERKITHERISLLDPASSMTIDFTSDELGVDGRDSYSVLRAEFDQWLAEQAEDAGAEFINGIAVEHLLKDDAGKVCGIEAGGDEITAQVVIDAEGQNSLISERELGNPRSKRDAMAVGIKEVFELPAEEIESRFLCNEGEGAAMLWAGDATHGYTGGGFLYTNKESISLGLVATIEDLSQSDTTIYQMLDDFKKHPSVAPIIRGATLQPPATWSPRAATTRFPGSSSTAAWSPATPGNLCMNLGYMVRGMDLAVESGRLAAGPPATRDRRRRRLQGRPGLLPREVGRLLRHPGPPDLRPLWPETMENCTTLFTDYPKMVGEIFRRSMFVVDGKPTSTSSASCRSSSSAACSSCSAK